MLRKTITAIGCLFLSVYAYAYDYDFEVNGIYYRINSMEKMEAEVVSGEKKYSGNIAIPMTVSFREKEFKVVGIGTKSFRGCDITSVSIPDGVRYVDSWSFQNCCNLKNIELPASLVGIGCSAFKNAGLTKIVIPNNVNQILDSAFVNCSAAKSITIGKSVKSDGLPSTTFIGCSNVEELIICDSKEELEIKCQARFMDNPENYTFGPFRKLKRVYVGRELKPNYKNYIFREDIEIEHLELGRYVRYFLPWTMELKQITVHRKVPFVSDPSYRRQGDFTSKTKMNAVLYVPEGCVDLYKKAELWKDFWTIKEIVK
ncbi:MAG: leucine-rich repeat domain-containing protein [Bacteroidaceae bacterium]|nr:leucine-rich repeat domain-containing protein [Bacteroidaceae bacterium]